MTLPMLEVTIRLRKGHLTIQTRSRWITCHIDISRGTLDQYYFGREPRLTCFFEKMVPRRVLPLGVLHSKKRQTKENKQNEQSEQNKQKKPNKQNEQTSPWKVPLNTHTHHLSPSKKTVRQARVPFFRSVGQAMADAMMRLVVRFFGQGSQTITAEASLFQLFQQFEKCDPTTSPTNKDLLLFLWGSPLYVHGSSQGRTTKLFSTDTCMCSLLTVNND